MPSATTPCARIFNRMGISALRLSKPYHDIRRPAELERSDYAVSANIGRTLSACRQAVVDIRCCIDWLEDQGYEHFGVLGTSLGSCYGFLASAHDPRIRVNAFNHASTAFGDVVWAGQSTRHVKQALDDAGMTPGPCAELWSAISPISYYDRIASAEAGGPDKKVLLVYANYDLTFPNEYSLKVVEAFTRIGLNYEKRVLPCGHYTTGETPFQYIDGWFMGSFVLSRVQSAAQRESRARARTCVRKRKRSGFALSEYAGAAAFRLLNIIRRRLASGPRHQFHQRTAFKFSRSSLPDRDTRLPSEPPSADAAPSRAPLRRSARACRPQPRAAPRAHRCG